jgi:hypothetical protein
VLARDGVAVHIEPESNRKSFPISNAFSCHGCSTLCSLFRVEEFGSSREERNSHVQRLRAIPVTPSRLCHWRLVYSTKNKSTLRAGEAPESLAKLLQCLILCGYRPFELTSPVMRARKWP